MEESPANMNASDSLVAEQLPKYQGSRSNFFDQPEMKINSSNDASSSFDYQYEKSFDGTVFEEYQDQINQIKIDFHTQRKQILNVLPSIEPKQAINLIPKNDELKNLVIQRSKELQTLRDDNIAFQQVLQGQTVNTKIIKDEIQLREQLSNFQSKIRSLLIPQALHPQQNDEHSFDVTNELMEKLRQRSKLTLETLKPYLEYSLKKQTLQNQNLQLTSQKLEQQSKIYNTQIQRQKLHIKQHEKLKKESELQDLIENQRKYGGGLNKYTKRYKIDMEIKAKLN